MKVATWLTTFDILKYLAYTIGFLSALSFLYLEPLVISLIVISSIFHILLIFFAMFLHRYAGYTNPKTFLTLIFTAT